MKPVNVRMAYINSLVSLIKEHIGTYGNYRKMRAPEMSVHGKDQNIRIVFHGRARNIVGELMLLCPKTDSDPDNLNVSNLLKTKVLEDWQEWVKGLGFHKREDKRDLWFGLDVLHLLSLIGFDIKAGLATIDTVHVTGHLAPNVHTNHGRFKFWFNATGGREYRENWPYYNMFGDAGGETKGDYQFVEKQAAPLNFTEETDLVNREIGEPTVEDQARAEQLLNSRSSLEALDQGYVEAIGVDELHYDMDTVVDSTEALKSNVENDPDEPTPEEAEAIAERIRQIDAGEVELIDLDEMERRFAEPETTVSERGNTPTHQAMDDSPFQG